MLNRREPNAVSKRVAATDERGFTLLETVIAFMILMIASLGVVSVFMYSVNYNAGGSNRLQAVAIAQQQLEILRAAKFNAPVSGVSKTDAVLAAGTTTTTVTGTDNRPYTVTTVIDDDPSTSTVDTNTTSTIKGITITVTPTRGGPTWAANSTLSAVTIITQRTRMN
ncbi:MAG TPA: type II secretion system protein [Pyrinomonadaceae bacterium]|nr:type II secretion system protein [Pyrinomonadaceae bacterium]